MGMCLDITIKQNGINAEWVKKFLPDFKSNQLEVNQYKDSVCVEYEGTYTGGVIVQETLHKILLSKSEESPVYMMVNDFESEPLYFKIVDCIPSQEITAYEYNTGEIPHDDAPVCTYKHIEHKYDSQKEYKRLCDLFSCTESEPLRDALIDRMNVLQDTNPLYVYCVWEDCIQLICVQDCDGDDDSPNNFAWDIQEYTVHPDNKVEHYDAGVLWGYVSSVEAAENELGPYHADRPQMYEADIQDAQFVVLCDYLSADYKRLLDHIKTLPKYTGDYLKGLVINE